MNLLFVNACVRGEESNTLKLCRAAMEAMQEKNPGISIEEVNLDKERPEPLHPEQAKERSALHAAKRYDHPIFAYARQFAAADRILIGAPYWDLSFPSILKIYLERICAVDVTFAYSEEGQPYGLCKAEKLLYVSTSGGPVAGYNMGYDYIKGLCDAFLGIPQVDNFHIEGLDMAPDTGALIQQGEGNIREMAKNWC